MIEERRSHCQHAVSARNGPAHPRLFHSLSDYYLAGCLHRSATNHHPRFKIRGISHPRSVVAHVASLFAKRFLLFSRAAFAPLERTQPRNWPLLLERIEPLLNPTVAASFVFSIVLAIQYATQIPHVLAHMIEVQNMACGREVRLGQGPVSG